MRLNVPTNVGNQITKENNRSFSHTISRCQDPMKHVDNKSTGDHFKPFQVKIQTLSHCFDCERTSSCFSGTFPVPSRALSAMAFPHHGTHYPPWFSCTTCSAVAFARHLPPSPLCFACAIGHHGFLASSPALFAVLFWPLHHLTSCFTSITRNETTVQPEAIG